MDVESAEQSKALMVLDSNGDLLPNICERLKILFHEIGDKSRKYLLRAELLDLVLRGHPDWSQEERENTVDILITEYGVQDDRLTFEELLKIYQDSALDYIDGCVKDLNS